jgi:hypothetical protein
MHLTHATDSNIDNERAKVVNDLWLTGCVDGGSLIPRDSLKVQAESASPIVTDSDIAVVRLNDCEAARFAPEQQGAPQQSRAEEVLLALGDDIARSNPISVGFNLIKSFEASQSNSREFTTFQAFNSQPKPRTEAVASYRWRRPSIVGGSVEIPAVLAQQSGALDVSAKHAIDKASSKPLN